MARAYLHAFQLAPFLLILAQRYQGVGVNNLFFTFSKSVEHCSVFGRFASNHFSDSRCRKTKDDIIGNTTSASTSAAMSL